MFRFFEGLGACAAVLLLPPAGSEAAIAKPAATACRVVVPKEIAYGPPLWIGPCRNGVADGVGTLRVRSPKGWVTFFFGRSVAGRPYSGIMTDEHNLFIVAHRFDRALNYVEPGGDRRKSMEAHSNAAAGATAASRHYLAHGNLASAHYYAERSRSYATAFE